MILQNQIHSTEIYVFILDFQVIDLLKNVLRKNKNLFLWTLSQKLHLH